MKKYTLILLLLTLFSCIDDLDLPYEKAEDKIVVNCLFSSDKAWSVMLTTVKVYSDSSFTLVDDAKVSIVPENMDTINLQYTNNGIYISDKKPQVGVNYELVVKTSQGQLIKAKSKIPALPVISSLNYVEQKVMYYFNANITNYDTFLLTLQITGSEPQNFVGFRYLSFNLNYGYLRYTVTNETIAELKKLKYSEAVLNELKIWINYSMTNNMYYGLVRRIAKKYNLTWMDENKIRAAFKETKVNYRGIEAFESGYLFSNSNWLTNVSRDIYNVFGEYTGSQNVTLFISSIPYENKGSNPDYFVEGWLDVVAMSEDYFKYQKSAIKQSINKDNPFASFVEVYSNIENGLGIFAGYNRKMIHVQDYKGE